jgi:hypothetical protein
VSEARKEPERMEPHAAAQALQKGPERLRLRRTFGGEKQGAL